MPERKKLELELNKKVSLELLFDEPMVGQSRYGDYYLYAVKNGGDTEYSFFAPDDVHERIKTMHRGDRFEITKTAEQKGSKILTKHEIKAIAQPAQQTKQISPKEPQTDNFYELMLKSCKDAIKIQTELGGMMDAKSLAVTLFIARSRINGFD